MYACLGGGACDVETLARMLASFRELERESGRVLLLKRPG